MRQKNSTMLVGYIWSDWRTNEFTSHERIYVTRLISVNRVTTVNMFMAMKCVEDTNTSIYSVKLLLLDHNCNLSLGLCL